MQPVKRLGGLSISETVHNKLLPKKVLQQEQQEQQERAYCENYAFQLHTKTFA